MRVSELVTFLGSFDKDDLVVLQRDSEGNGYSPLEGGDAGTYVAESPWSGEVRYRELTEELRDLGYADEDVAIPDGVDALACVVLWPVN